MTNTSDLPGRALGLGAEKIQHKQDRKRSISSTTIRFVKDGWRGVAVGADVKHQLDVFTDLIDLHLQNADGPLDREDVWVWFAERPRDRETDVAMRTLADERARRRVHLRVITADHKLRELDGERIPWKDDEHYSYSQWAKLLADVPDELPSLVSKLLEVTDRQEYRAYPMLSSHGKQWSIRFEGLQVAVLLGHDGRLGGRQEPGQHEQQPAPGTMGRRSSAPAGTRGSHRRVDRTRRHPPAEVRDVPGGHGYGDPVPGRARPRVPDPARRRPAASPRTARRSSSPDRTPRSTGAASSPPGGACAPTARRYLDGMLRSGGRPGPSR